MNVEDRVLFVEAMGELRDFRGELREFRLEIKEFKEIASSRFLSLEKDRDACQKNPAVCATARTLERHLQSFQGGKSLAVSVWVACVSTVMCVGSFVLALVKRS